MMKFLYIFIILNLYNPAFASIKEKILSKMKDTNNLNFNFIQTINDNSESGNCIIEYPKKIFCEYEKIIVSNGRSLVIKNNNYYYIYPLKKTPLEFILDKNYLIKKIKNLEPREIDNKYLNFTIFEDSKEINLFFNKKTFDLIGWQTEDVYQNLAVTFISSISINKNINDAIFILPKND